MDTSRGSSQMEVDDADEGEETMGGVPGGGERGRNKAEDDDESNHHLTAGTGGDEDREEDRADDDDGTDDDADNGDDEVGDSDGQEEEKNQDKAASRPLKKKKTRQHHHIPKIFQDAITVVIPLDVTADLKIAIRHTRSKRIKSILKKYPSLKPEAKQQQDDGGNVSNEDDGDALVDDEDDENGREDSKDEKRSASNSSNRKKKIENVPRPDQYGSVLDYLEAKYVKGVMLDEDDEDGGPILDDDDKSEGQGSVYSKDSFLDDTDLQRDVAEQVMASTTLTKLELEEEDGDFFVNVGNLEVENDDYGDHYDPLQDKENQTAKKRKKPSTSSSAAGAAPVSTPSSKKVKVANVEDQPVSAKSKKSTTSVSSSNSKRFIKSDEKTPDVESAKSVKTGDVELVKIAKQAKARSDSLFKKAVAMVKKLTDEDLPRRKTKLKVALTCPANKKPGDDITFTNPHNPGQRLRVKVPKDCFPGGTFKVTVPVKPPDGNSETDKFSNRIPRELQDVLDDYARAYDEWCTAQSKIDTSFETFKEKQGKYDKVAKEFPSNLVTKVTGDYLKQVVRRCRQNKYKRGKTAAAKQQPSPTPVVKGEPPAEEEAEEEEQEDEEEGEQEDEEEEEEEKSSGRIVDIPAMGKMFPSLVWDSIDFTVS